MASLHAFEVAIDLAQQQRDGARALVMQVRHQCRLAQDQLAQLIGYARETRQRWGAQPDAVLLPEVLRYQTQFLQRLEQTVTLQRTVVEEQLARVQRAAQALAQAEARVASLRHVLQRRQREQARQEQRREQKETDELAMQRHGRAGRGTGRQLTQGI